MQELIDLIARYGLALVFINVLVEQVGLPVPAVPTLIVAGAAAATGQLSAPAVFGVAVLACYIGDGLWFAGIGIALWAGLPIGAGMLFSREIERVVGSLERYGAVAVELIVALLAAYIAL